MTKESTYSLTNKQLSAVIGDEPVYGIIVL